MTSLTSDEMRDGWHNLDGHQQVCSLVAHQLHLAKGTPAQLLEILQLLLGASHRLH